MLATDFKDLCTDVALDESEDVGIRAPLDLADQPFLVGIEEWQAIDLGQPVRQELLRDVEPASANDIAVDVPADTLGIRDALGIAIGSGCCNVCFHLNPPPCQLRWETEFCGVPARYRRETRRCSGGRTVVAAARCIATSRRSATRQMLAADSRARSRRWPP